MIGIEAYRATIGSYLSKARLIFASAHHYQSLHTTNYFQDKFINESSVETMSFLKVFAFIVLLFTLYLNLNMSFLKLMCLPIDGDVESNPGPTYSILKVVQGSFNQANLKFGETAGRQCACNTLFSIAWSVIRQVGLWNSSDLDFILNEGDKIYKGLHIGTFISADELPQCINIENNEIYVEKLRFHQGTILKHSVNFLRNSYESNINNGNGFLLFINGFTLSVIWSNANFFLFDSHSRDKDGQICENGLSVLLKFRSLNAVEKYVKGCTLLAII